MISWFRSLHNVLLGGEIIRRLNDTPFLRKRLKKTIDDLVFDVVEDRGPCPMAATQKKRDGPSNPIGGDGREQAGGERGVYTFQELQEDDADRVALGDGLRNAEVPDAVGRRLGAQPEVIPQVIPHVLFDGAVAAIAADDGI